MGVSRSASRAPAPLLFSFPLRYHARVILLSATNLHRAYGRRVALRGVDLAVSAGETLAVVGPNGAGKTTLLRCLAGVMRPTAGEILLEGTPVRGGDPASRAGIGLLSHRSMLYDDLTVRENLAFAARLYGLPDPLGAAHRALDEVGLLDRADDLPRALSRGLLQRAALARALLHHPRLLLLDEPFTGLDLAAADRLRDLLRARRPAGLGTIVVTHQVAEVWELATEVRALVAGQWVDAPGRDAPLETFLTRYREVAPA